MVTMLLTHDCIKWSQPQYLQDHNPNYRQKIIPNILKNKSKQPDRWRHPKQQASRQLTGWIRKICRVGRAEFINLKKKSVTKKGDLAGLDFVVNRAAYSVISRFHGSLESSCGQIMCKLVEYCFKPTGISSFPRIGQFAVFALPLKTLAAHGQRFGTL